MCIPPPGAHGCGTVIASVRSYHGIIDATSRCGNVYDIGVQLILLTPCCAMMLVAIAKHQYMLGQVLEPVWHDQVCRSGLDGCNLLAI